MTPLLLALTECAGHGIADACDVARPIAREAAGLAADLLELVAERLRETEHGLAGDGRGARLESPARANQQGVGEAHGGKHDAPTGFAVVKNPPVCGVETPEEAVRLFGGSLSGWREVFAIHGRPTAIFVARPNGDPDA